MFAGLTFLILSGLISILISPSIIDMLYKFKIVRGRRYDDVIDRIHRRKDKIGTPMMGGIIIILTVIIITLIFNWNKYTEPAIIVLLIGALLGSIDDLLNIFGQKERKVYSLKHHIKLVLIHKNKWKRIYLFLTIPWALYKSLFNSVGSRYGTGLYPHERILVQIISGIVASYFIFFKLGIHSIWLFSNHYLNIGLWIIPLILIIIIATSNAVNISDGIDGLATGAMLASFMSFFVIALQEGNESIAIICATVSGALVTYLYFNIKPARIQMGDIGTLGLGSLLAVISIILKREILLIIIGGIFVIETLSVIVQKLYKRFFGKKIFLMSPLHHHLEMLGWSEEKITARLWLFAFALSILGIWLSML